MPDHTPPPNRSGRDRCAVMFDFDGTLADSLEDIAEAMNAVLLRLGFPEHPVAAYRHFVGDGMEALVRRALPAAAGDEETLARALPAMRAEYVGRSTRKTRLYEGIPDLLDALRERGVPAAILSNKPHTPLLSMTEQLLGRWSFDAVLGTDEDTPRKPDPAGALRIAAQLGIPPERWLYLGDTDTDMRTARAAGMRAVGVLWGFRSEEELREAGASVLLRRPEDLLPHLD